MTTTKHVAAIEMCRTGMRLLDGWDAPSYLFIYLYICMCTNSPHTQSTSEWVVVKVKVTHEIWHFMCDEGLHVLSCVRMCVCCVAHSKINPSHIPF